jgi:hypothetical protein
VGRRLTGRAERPHRELDLVVAGLPVRHETLIARRPFQLVPLIQTSPPSWTAASTASVISSVSKRKSTWFSTTSFSTSTPSSSPISAAKRRAQAQVRSTSSATPLRPSVRSAA